MKTKANLPKGFYQNLGKLFYAIAAADGKVEKTEINELKNFVKSHWKDVNAIEKTAKHASHQIDTIFDRLNTGAPDADACFYEFIDYKDEHPSLFSENINKLILKTASAIANSFSSLNKSELIMMAKLDMALKK